MKTYAIDGIRDGFGSQYLKKIGGFAYCEWEPNYKYIHIPFITIEHVGPDMVEKLNKFIGIPDMRPGNSIDVKAKWQREVFDKPDRFYTDCTMDKIRAYYWANKKPESCQQDIVVHIRRGDLGKTPKGRRLIHPKRITPNEYYNKRIPMILNANPNCSVKIHTSILANETRDSISGDDLADCHKDYRSIFLGWDRSLIKRTTLHINADIRNTFHDMVTCKKLFMARSSLSYCAALLSVNEVFFQNGVSNSQTHWPLRFWKNWEEYGG